jgi:hypothetical protein
MREVHSLGEETISFAAFTWRFRGFFHWHVPKYMAGEGILYAFWGDLFAFSAL